MDFYQIRERSTKRGETEIYPEFVVRSSQDFMVRGKSFYAIWNEEKGLWSTDEFDVQRIVDQDLRLYYEKRLNEVDGRITVRYLQNFSNNAWTEYRRFVSSMPDANHTLDDHVTFANTPVKKTDYVSKRLPYSLERGSIDAYDELVGTLYDGDNRAKLEWAIGSIVAGDSRDIQKFVVLYGEGGTGKSTILNIIQKLFEGYYTTFEAKELTSSSNAFSTESFRSNPLVGIQHDGDLSRIEDNTKLNSIVSHEEMVMNEKYKSSYTARTNCFLFMATNRPVKITDAKSGIIRRLIDVEPSGRKIPPNRYEALKIQIDFELGAIAEHCLSVYREMGKNFYSNYRPYSMMLKTDVFFNFVEANVDIFLSSESITLKRAYDIYKEYCEEALVEYRLPKYKFREELKNYFKTFEERGRVDGQQARSVYSGFILSKLQDEPKKEEEVHSLALDKTTSLLDEVLSDQLAQYATEDGKPIAKWNDVATTLKELDTSRRHYVRVPPEHIVIDFDLKDSSGEKSLELNLAEASKFPPTYAELSQGGKGVHLHYIYSGDPSKLSRVYSPNVEIKVFYGNSSLRRKLTKCNDIPIATISTGLPLKGEKMVNFDAVKSEKGLRDLIERNLRKEIHPGTKPSVDFIFKILEDAYNSGLKYDVTDLRPKILAFANNSTHQSEYCVKLVSKMKFASEETSEPTESYDDDRIVFFDVEVFPNLFLLNWKYQGEDMKCTHLINPSPSEIESFMKMKLVGFNCRRYDNHILYARYLGYDNEQIFKLSQKIIAGSRNAMFGEAYNISYTDVLDFSSKKQSLKKFEIDLGIHHQELGYPWDHPVPEEKWHEVAEYCDNDVIATEAVFNARKADWIAREILADLSGLTVNDTTQQHAAKIIFGNDPNPQSKFVYTDLSEMFPGYKFENGKSTYRGEETGEGGYVYSEPGMYTDVALLDIASMHPTSIEQLNLFGPYTSNFSDIKAARIAIKHKQFDDARGMLGGVLSKYLTEEGADDLAYALKIVINIVYGLTSAKFTNKFKDPRNIDNIVAKRGALFMIDLKHAVQERGFTVAHIKTDSIKIPNATPEIIEFVMEFGKKYGYIFEHEATYSKMCLVNDAVYIAKYKDGKHAGEWTATGAQFAQPVVFKTLFSKEPVTFEDMCETKSVTSALYLDMNEGMGPDEHNYVFVGKTGQFSPVVDGSGGGYLVREKDGKYYSATASKGYRWLESEVIRKLHKEKSVDFGYYAELVQEALDDIGKFGDPEWFTSDEVEPWTAPGEPWKQVS